MHGRTQAQHVTQNSTILRCTHALLERATDQITDAELSSREQTVTKRIKMIGKQCKHVYRVHVSASDMRATLQVFEPSASIAQRKSIHGLPSSHAAASLPGLGSLHVRKSSAETIMRWSHRCCCCHVQESGTQSKSSSSDDRFT